MYRRLNFKPSIDVESTATGSPGGWNASNLIRFRNGLGGIYAEKLGGWSKVVNSPVTGICRAVNFWADLSTNLWYVLGTNTDLYVEKSGLLSNITPVGWLGGPASSGAVPYSLLVWSLDNFGQVLLACPSGGTIYQWVPTVITPATAIADAPAVNQGMFVSAQQQIAIAYGCTPVGGGSKDPLLVRWSAQGDYATWTPSAVNQAGSYRIPRGSRVTAGISTPLGNLIFTDLDVWQMQYIGFPLVYSFLPAGLNCGVISQKCVGVLGTSVYWMSQHGFFQYNGGSVTQIPCSVWDAVFYNLDFSNQDKVCCLISFDFNEVWWFFPSISGGTGEIDMYAKYNNLTQTWDYGSLARTAGTDQNQPGGPVWVDLNGFMQQHENGVDADGAPMTGVFITSGFNDIDDGENFPLSQQFIPDFLWTLSTAATPTIQVTMLFQNWPGDVITTQGPYDITPTTEFITLRVRARQIALKFSCDALGTWFRVGVNRLMYTKAGKV